MSRQRSTEAILSAAYVDNYLDCVENLPNDLQRHLTRMRELDVTYREYLRDAETNMEIALAPDTDDRRRLRAARRLHEALVAAQETADDKLQVVQRLQELIDHRQRSLDADHKKLVSCMEVNSNGNSKKKSTPSPQESNKSSEKESSSSAPPRKCVPPTPAPAPLELTTEMEKERGERDKSEGST